MSYQDITDGKYRAVLTVPASNGSATPQNRPTLNTPTTALMEMVALGDASGNQAGTVTNPISVQGVANGVQVVNLASDTTFSPYALGFTANAAGNVKIVDYLGNTVTIPVLAGQWFAVRLTKIFSTANGTTATPVVALLP